MPTPPLGRRSKQTQRDQRSRNSKFAQITPVRLRAILDDAARGQFADFADLTDRMKREDDHVRATYETRLSAVAGTRYVIEPPMGSTDEIDRLFARFCAEVLSGMMQLPGDWSSLDDANLAMRLLDGIGGGFAVCELAWSKALRSQGAILAGDWVVPTAYWIHQRRFEFGDDWTIRLRDDGSQTYGEGIELEPNKFMVHIPQSIAGYPTQTGVFHAVAWPWLFKRWGNQWWMDGMERFAWPTPYIEQDENATEETAEDALDFLDGLTQGKNAVLPVGTDAKLLETGVKDGMSWERFVQHQDRAISKGILGNTDSTEPSKVGAWKAVESRTGTTVHARMSMDAHCLGSTYRTQLFAPLRRFNPRFAAAALPSIRWTIAAERKDIPPHIVQAGALTINEIRAAQGLPPRADGDRLVGMPAAPQMPAQAPTSTPPR